MTGHGDGHLPCHLSSRNHSLDSHAVDGARRPRTNAAASGGRDDGVNQVAELRQLFEEEKRRYHVAAERI